MPANGTYLDNTDSESRRPGAVGVGAPLLQREVLAALHVSNVRAAPAGADVDGRIVGFPDYELRREDAKIISLSAYPVPHQISAETLAQNESYLGEGLSIGPLEPATIVDGVFQLGAIIITATDDEAEREFPQ